MDAAPLGLMPLLAKANDGASEPPLVACGLKREFSSGRGVFDVDLQVESRQFLALVGPSGAGKTTLLRLLAGIERPDAGTLTRFGNRNARARRGDTRVALVFQRPRLVGRLSAVENVLAGRLGHLPRWQGLLKRFAKRDWKLAFECLDQVGLLSHAGDRADRLSGGEQQRVSIARALAQEPKVLLADEPVASLDPTNARIVLSVLRRCADQGLAVVASLHQPELALEFSDRLIALNNGRIEAMQ